MKKTKVVLGEISNIIRSENLVKAEKPISSKAKKAKNACIDEQVIIVEEDDKICDPQMCDDYVTDIYDYLHIMEKEVKRRPMADYIEPPFMTCCLTDDLPRLLKMIMRRRICSWSSWVNVINWGRQQICILMLVQC